MERVLSQEERIRRAEEIYYRRKLNNSDVRMPSSQVRDQTEKRQFSLYRKMAIQVLLCILIYLGFSLIKEANYLFSESIINKTKEFLNYDINFEVISSNINEFWKNNKDKFNIFVNDEQPNTENTNNQETNTETTNEETQNNESEQNTNAENNTNENNETTGIGGSSTTEDDQADESTKKSQMELDAEYIKNNFSMQLPVKAKVTSGYGKREADKIVSADHYGIDLGVVVGTTVLAAMEGTVTLVSDEGEYGTHVKIVNKDVTTIYAHCSKILVKKGEKVTKGQKIALSGNTGKTTGPHLHFEIRRGERSVDPALVLNF
mgnify:FL=1